MNKDLNLYLKLLNRVCFFSNYNEKFQSNNKNENRLNSFYDFIEKSNSIHSKDLFIPNQDQNLIHSKNIAIDLNKVVDDYLDQKNINKDIDIIVKSKPSELFKFYLNPNIDYTIYESNPYFKTQLNPINGYDFLKEGLHKFSLTLKNEFPETAFLGKKQKFLPTLPNQIPTTTLNYDFKFNNHWGQRKLLYTEIDFLTYCLSNKNEKIDIIYAGAAHGTHLPFLLKLFPNITFHLYDPAYDAFDTILKSYVDNQQIFINQYYHEKYPELDKYEFFKKKKKRDPEDYGYMTDEVAEYYKNKFFNKEGNYSEGQAFSNCLFISDIRRNVQEGTYQNEKEYAELFEKNVLEDQDMQGDWIRILKPKFSMFKFKLPYPDIDKNMYYRYMKGNIRFQCWGPLNSAETRIIISHKNIDEYFYINLISFERKMAYYNYLRQLNLNNKNIWFLKDTKNNKSIDLKTIGKYICTNVSYYTIDFYNEMNLLFQYIKKYNLLQDEIEFQNLLKNVGYSFQYDFQNKSKILFYLIITIMRYISKLIGGSPLQFRFNKKLFSEE